MSADRSDIVEAIREYEYARESLGGLADVDDDVRTTVDTADDLVRVVREVLDIKRYEL